MARETEHGGQKQIRCADDFCRGLIPTVCANIYTATDLCPTSISRLQRRQNKFSKGPFLAASISPKENTGGIAVETQVRRRIPESCQPSALSFQ